MFQVLHKCHPGDAEPRDFSVMNHPEEGVVELYCTVCRENFWVLPNQPDFWEKAKGASIAGANTRIPGLILPGHRA